MPLVDDLEAPTTPEELARRRFLTLVSAGALGVGVLGATAATLQFIEPSVRYEADKRIFLGRPEDIAVGTVLSIPRSQIFVLRTEAGFIALSTVCVHLGCIVRFNAEAAGFACPCHGSRYGADGSLRQGPATASLRRLALSVERGQLVVDAGKVVAPDTVFRMPA